MKYMNITTGKIVAESKEELMKYYEMTYKENVEGGYLDSNDCSLEEWIESDTDVVEYEEN